MKTATKMMNEPGPKYYLTGCDTFLLGGALFLLITYHEIEGMVGESEYWATARVYNTVTGETSKPMKWEEIRRAYLKVQGKNERVKLWRIMREWLSPEAREEIAKCIESDAIFRVI